MDGTRWVVQQHSVLNYSFACSRSSISVSGSTRCPWYFFPAHAACFPESPFKYASMNRWERVEYLVREVSERVRLSYKTNVLHACLQRNLVIWWHGQDLDVIQPIWAVNGMACLGWRWDAFRCAFAVLECDANCSIDERRVSSGWWTSGHAGWIWIGTLQKSWRLEMKGNMVSTNILLVVPRSCLTVPQQVLDAPPTFLPGHRECVVSGYISIFGHHPVQAQLQKAQGEFEDSASEKVLFTTVCRYSRRQI